MAGGCGRGEGRSRGRDSRATSSARGAEEGWLWVVGENQI